jgi:hypothetical protein
VGLPGPAGAGRHRHYGRSEIREAAADAFEAEEQTKKPLIPAFNGFFVVL